MGTDVEISLTDLAARINAEHAAVIRGLRITVEHALVVGDLLIEAKQQVKNEGGDWLPWLESQCGLSPRVAQNYMRLARNREEIGTDTNPNAYLGTISSALALLAPPPTEPPPSKEFKASMDKVKRFDKWERDTNQELLDKALAVGRDLLALRDRIESGEAGHVGWWTWFGQHFARKRPDAERYMNLASVAAQESIALNDSRFRWVWL